MSRQAPSASTERLSLDQLSLDKARPDLRDEARSESPAMTAVHSEATRKILAGIDGGAAGDSSNSGRSSMDSVRSTSSADWPTHPLELTTVGDLHTFPPGTEVNFRARIHTQRPISKALDFLLLRDQTDSVQGVLSRENMDMVRWVQKLAPESLVEVHGVLKAPPEPVRSATQAGLEVDVQSIFLVNAAHNAPFSISD